MSLNLLKLQIVELIEKHRRITAVADQLGLKQPTVTYHMKTLEQEMGVRLFEPRMDKIILTEAGKALLHYAVKINSLSSEAQRIVGEFGRMSRGSLRIGASYVPATYLLPRVLREFAAQYPGVTVSLSVKPSPIITNMLLNHEVDLGIISTEVFRQPPIELRTICEDELVLVCAPGHHLASYSELSPALISTANLILHGKESSTRQMTDRWMELWGIRVQGFLELDSLEAIKQAVMQGGHASFVSRLAVQSEVERGLLVVKDIPDFEYVRNVCYAYNKDRHYSQLLEQFIGFLHADRSSTAPVSGVNKEMLGSI
ncbi:DNA-binding transcriptional LysR family regulator [Paenibacillus phyllosphaerae]|uniref:DNA-binding transcriptional LysR family regulator n=1 Tax=Paenibacillus phyllosphaerae TaxID=274593 RepID=A0A7W5AT99_9BACL|nr:LysR family transcriptional regulator [Paenibacillus phyllosphaerae]MBB3108293.1 DNA-binding transcriptional LysR family regulator [Paenibacillus phyllosphaerae]